MLLILDLHLCVHHLLDFLLILLPELHGMTFLYMKIIYVHIYAYEFIASYEVIWFFYIFLVSWYVHLVLVELDFAVMMINAKLFCKGWHLHLFIWLYCVCLGYLTGREFIIWNWRVLRCDALKPSRIATLKTVLFLSSNYLNVDINIAELTLP